MSWTKHLYEETFMRQNPDDFDWDYEFKKDLSVKDMVERIQLKDSDEKIGPLCQGMTYYEIEQLEKSYMYEDYSHGK